jgi:hypothetical protein
MSQSAYQPEDLRSFREAAAGLAESHEDAKAALEAATIKGDLKAAQGILAEASLKTKAYQELRDKLGPTGIFLAKYGVEVINDHTILFVLPKGCSRIDILNEAQGLVRGMGSGHLIEPDQLKDWQQDGRFTKQTAASERICIDGHVKGGDAKNRATQETFVSDKGLSLASFEDLAVAFALHWVATGEGLFGWLRQNSYSYRVRGAGGSLHFTPHGLGEDSVSDAYDKYLVAVSARVSPESK